MTILGAVCRDDFVVLAADSRVTNFFVLASPPQRKIICHKTLPIAIGIAGAIECESYGTVGSAVRYALDQLSDPVDVNQVAELLDRLLGQQFRRTTSLSPFGVLLHIATMVRGRGQAARACWHHRASHAEVTNIPLVDYGGSVDAVSFFDRRLEAERTFASIETPAGVVESLRLALFEAIAHEQAVCPGCTVGPPVDVALVDVAGARIVSTTMRSDDVNGATVDVAG